MMTVVGVIQIGSIVREDVTKNGDKVVYFTGYTRRGEESDKIFCKVFGKNAEYLIRNLPKKNDGTYASRKVEISGYLETYISKKPQKCEPYVIQPSDLDVSFGVLHQPIQVVISKEVEEERFLVRVNHLDFVDKKKDANFVEILASSESIHNKDTIKNSEEQEVSTDRKDVYKEPDDMSSQLKLPDGIAE